MRFRILVQSEPAHVFVSREVVFPPGKEPDDAILQAARFAADATFATPGEEFLLRPEDFAPDAKPGPGTPVIARFLASTDPEGRHRTEVRFLVGLMGPAD
jgi:hypothetical protein